MLRKAEGKRRLTSIFTPICDNPNFVPEIPDPDFKLGLVQGFLAYMI